MNDGTDTIYKTVSTAAGEWLYFGMPPVRSGYQFNGWYSDPGCNEFFADGSTATANLSLYANWVNVSYNSSLGALEADEIYFTAGKYNSTVFSIRSDAPVNLYSAESGSVVCHMHDDGLDGDITANDGIYSCKITKNVSDNHSGYYSTLNFYAKTDTEKSITKTLYFFGSFTEESEQEMYNILEEIKNIGSRYKDEEGYTIISKANEAAIAVENYLNGLYMDGHVISCDRSGDSVFAKLSSGFMTFYTPKFRHIDSSDGDTALTILTFQPWLSEYQGEATLTQYLSNTDEAASNVDKIHNCSFSSSNNYDDSMIDVDLLRTVFGPNQIVIWHGHGNFLGCVNSIPVDSILTINQIIDKTNPINEANYKDDSVHNRIFIDCDKVGITYKFFDYYYNDFSNSFFYLGCCHSGQTDTLANSIISKGASAVVGNTDYIYTKYNLTMQKEIISKMAEINAKTEDYYTLGEAVDEAKNKFGQNHLQMVKSDYDNFTIKKSDYEYVKKSSATPIIFGDSNYRFASNSTSFSGTLKMINDPVIDASIEILRFDNDINKYSLYKSGYSDENGKFNIAPLSIGSYNAVISKDGYVKKTVSFDIKSIGETIEMPIVLEPTLKAVINMPDGITDDMSISIKHEGEEYSHLTKETDDGFVAILPTGTYAISLNVNGYVYSESISVSDELQTRIEINFKPSVTLYVYDENTNEPITGAVITGASLSTGLSTNSEGRCGLALGVGSHELYINADGYSEYSIIVIITEADLLTPFEQPIPLSKETAVDITITVLDENGDPFEIPDGMTVTVENNSGEYWEKNISSDKTAAFSLLKGTYTASVNFTGVVGNKNDGFGNATWTGQTTFSVPLDNNTQPVIKVAESVETAPLKTFIVQEAGGIPVSGALLLINSASTDAIALTTDSDGKASITLPPDKFIASVHKKAGANKWNCGGGFVTVIVTESVNEYIITADKEEYIPGNIADISAGYRTAAVLMKDGTAYTWGNNSWGSAGVGNNDDSSIPSATRILLNHITAVFKGNDNCGAAISGNKLYVWGIGSSGQLGLGTPEELGDRWKQYGAVYREIEPTLNPYISTASKAGIGKKFMIILSDGKVYGCGDNNGGIVNGVPGSAIYSPVLIEGLNSIVDISVGDYFSMALTADGDVYTWGSTSQNVLGREWSSEGALTPGKVEIDEKVIDISAGYNRAAVVTESGKLFSWGSGTGKLPTEITVDGGKKVIDVELGESVSACITEDNCLYTWGNKTGAGHGDTDSCSAPTLLLENIAKVALGENFGLALTYDGKLYIWGSDNWSQQCNGEGNQHDNPTPVELILTP